MKTKRPRPPYVVHDPHRDGDARMRWGKRLQIIAIDPGITAMGMRWEERPCVAGFGLPVMRAYRVIDVSAHLPIAADGTNDLYPAISRALDQDVDLDAIHVVLIERQMARNSDMWRVGQHIITHYLEVLRDRPLRPLIIEVDARRKWRALGLPRGVKGAALGSWGIDKARSFLRSYGDEKSLAILARERKKQQTDLSVTVLEIVAFAQYKGWDTPSPPAIVEIIAD